MQESLEKENIKLKRKIKFLELQNLEIDKLKEELSYIKNSRIWKFREILLGRHLNLVERIGLLFSIIPILSSISRFFYNTYLNLTKTTFLNTKEENVLISVVIPFYNYYDYIDECIDSVLVQGLENKVEIIIVEGFSDDGSREKLKERNWLNTKIVFQEHRTSIGENRLRGIEESTGRYICLLDPDDKLAPDYFKKAIEELERGHYDVVYPDVRYFEDVEEDQIAIDFVYDNIFWFNFISVSSIFRRSFWEKHKIGYSNNSEIFEDWDFWMRMAKAGARFKHIDGTYLLYRIHTSTKPSTTDIRLEDQVQKDKNTKDIYKDFVYSKEFYNAKKRQSKKFKVINADINITW